MGVRRFLWFVLILGTSYSVVLAEEKKESNRNTNYKDNVINNEIISRKPSTNKTVAKVEAILAKNPTLPRLTRGEIVAILENITKSDEEKSKLLNINVTAENKLNNNYSGKVDNITNEDNNSTRDGKSLLVVLPYNPSNDSKVGLEVLYTKEPMTRLLHEATTPTSVSHISRKPHSDDLIRGNTLTNSTTTTPRPHQRRRKPMKPIVVLPQEQRPVYVHNTKTSSTTQPPFESSSEEQWRPYTAYDSPLVVTQKPSTVEIRLPDSMKNTLNSFNLPKNHKPEGQQVFVTLPDNQEMFSTTTKRPRKKNRNKTTPSGLFSITPSPPVNKPSKSRRKTTPLPDISAAVESLTPEMKIMLAQLGLVPGQPDGRLGYPEVLKTTTVPTPVNLKPIGPTVDIASYMSFKPLPVKGKYNENNDDMDNDMKQILSNFGLLSTENQPMSYRNQKSLEVDEEDDKNVTAVEGNGSKSEKAEEQIQKNKQMTLSEINTDVLSDEMKDMLEDLGVIRDSKRRGKGHIFNPVTQSALLEKPEKAERISKVIGDIKKLSEDNATHSLDTDAIKAHLENITSVVFDDDDNKSEFDEGNKEGEEDLSFSQSENEADDDEDRGVIFGANGKFEGYEPDEEELLRIQGVQDNSYSNNIKRENTQATWNSTNNEPIEDILSSKKLQEIMSHPDPLSLEELHQLEEAADKNEVKRQQPEGTTDTPGESGTTLDSSSSSSETTTSSAPEERASSTTESAAPETITSSEAPPNIQDLEDSFGGETPPSRPNGLYFLLDWNSFLRVGQDNRTVNLSFSPKVGDPRNFIPVSVP